MSKKNIRVLPLHLFCSIIMSNLYLFLSDYQDIFHNKVWNSLLYLVQLKNRFFFSQEFQICVNTSEAAKCIQLVYKVDAQSGRNCRRWPSHFSTGNFRLEDESKTVAQKQSIQMIWNQLLQAYPATRELSKDIFNVSYTVPN